MLDYSKLSSIPPSSIGEAAAYVYYSLLAAVCTGLIWVGFYKRFPKVKDWVAGSLLKYAMWAHGVMTFSVMFFLEPNNLRLFAATLGLSPEATSVVKYSLQSCLALVLWDFGYLWTTSPLMVFQLNCHHIGLFIALHYGFSLSEQVLASQAHLDSCLFGWLWAIHSFGFILKIIFPILGIKTKPEQKSHLLDAIKHVYSAVSVYWIYQYLNAPGQPGLHWNNYQTCSLAIMLSGRYLINSNWKNIDFLRRVEVPGAFVVLVDHFFFNDPHLHRGVATLFALVACILTHAVLMKRVRSQPAKYFGPAESPELQSFLEAKSGEILGKISSNDDDKKVRDTETTVSGRKYMHGMFSSQESTVKDDKGNTQSWKDAWPIHLAAVNNDTEQIEKLTCSSNFKQTQKLDAKMTDYQDYTPLLWAGMMGNTESQLLLLKKGANPYVWDGLRCMSFFDSCFESNFFLPNRVPGSLGGCVDFWVEFNKIAMKKSPPSYVWDDLSAAERAMKIVAKW